MLTPIATIKLDTPGSSGTIRGVLCYDDNNRTIVTMNPEGYYPETDPEAPDLVNIEAALLHVQRAWGYDAETWGLEWLCDDHGDYCRAWGIID